MECEYGAELSRLLSQKAPQVCFVERVQPEESDYDRQVQGMFAALKERLEQKKVCLIKREALEVSKEILGKGGFGVVYRGRFKHTEVAIKYFAVYPDEFTILEEEIVTTTNLRHPRIVPLYGVSLAMELGHIVCMLVMELMVCDLETHLARSALAPADKKGLIRQLLEGVSFIHGERIIHRDLKPKNILVDSTGNIKVADLGISTVAC